MEFTFIFLHVFVKGIFFVAPLLLTLALVGMVFTGIMVALAVNAVSEAYKILKPDF